MLTRYFSTHPKLFWSLVSLLALVILIAPVPAALAAPQERFIQIKASAFQFEPGVIFANPGDQVTLELTSLDLVHGLYIDGYDLDVMIEPGQTTRLSFTADHSGAFRLRCSIACGAMHPFMVGKLQVGPNWLLWKAVALAAVSLFGVVIFKWRGAYA